MGQYPTPNTYLPRTLYTLLTALLLCIVSSSLSAQSMDAFITHTAIPCHGGTCTASVTVTGDAQPPFTYLWSNGLTTQNVVVPAGIYSVIVLDSQGQTATDTVTIQEPAALGVAIVTEQQICAIAPDGAATAVPFGGTVPYSFQWSNGGNTAQITGLSAGIYSVTVTDANNCTTTGEGEVEYWDEGLWLMVTPTDVLCHGDSTGSIKVTPMSGTPPYTYIWSTGDTTATVSNLPAGTYSVTVTDVNGCENSMSGEILEPAPLVLTLGASGTSSCDSLACASVQAAGGTPPYTFLWSTGADTDTICGVTPGLYFVTATDANLCTAVDSIEIIITDTLNITIEVTGCAGCVIGGSATATVGSGSGNYSFEWDNGDTGPTADSLSAGMHTVIVTDLTNGCVDTATVDIPACPPLNVDVQTDSPATCLEGGQATADVSGGVPPYTIQWDNGQSGPTADSLSAGQHTVTVTDATGCVAVDTFIMELVPGPEVTIQVTGCAGCTIGGSATAGVSGGSGNYGYLWDNGDTTVSADSLSAGPHILIVTDLATGCSDTSTVDIPACPPLNVDVQTDSLATCLEGGQATANVSGGVPPYTIQWDNGQTGPTADSLSAGQHTVTVTDSTGCVVVDTFNMGVVPGPQISIQVTSCAGCNVGGSANATISAGSGNYGYLWDNGDTTASADSLAAGPHTLIVTDLETGCSDTATVDIPVCTPLSVSVQIDSLATCISGGKATADVSGGQAPYNIQWDNGQTGMMATGLSSGPHSVTVTDATGCIAIANFTMGQTPGPDVSAVVLSHAECGVGGSAEALPSGGLPPYIFLWDNGDTTAVADSLSAGVHCVTVTDSNGCADTACVTINPPPNAPVVVITVVTPASCLSGATLQASVVSGGTPPYTYVWSNGDTTAEADSLPPGIHCVTVTDSNGCSNFACDTVDTPMLPDPVAVVVTPANCLTGATANVSATGGVPPYTYLWMPGNYTSGNVTNLPPGTYTITVTDLNGCSGSTTLTISPPQLPVISVVSTSKQSCNALGTASVTAAGGTPPYTYVWENGEEGPMADSLFAGNHFVIVTDAAGCMDTTSVSISFTPDGIAIGDFVWYDDDQDGFQDAQETDGVSDIVVRLTQAGPDGLFNTADDVTVASDTTGPDGMYRFECVVPGDYILVFSGVPFGFQWAGKNLSNDDCKDSDVNLNGRTDPFTITQTLDDDFCFDAGVHMLCQNVINAGLVCCNQTICEGETPAVLTQVSPPVGGQGPLEFLWLTLDQSGPGPPIWVGIPGATGPNYQPGPLTATSYFMRCARRAGCIQFLESNVITITVLPAGSPGCGNFLKNFTVEALGNYRVKVDWTTIPEPVQFIYSVEHSADQLQWRTFATRIGNYNPTEDNSYTALDQTPIRGRNYYRIKRVDPFGLVSYSEVRYVDLDLPFTEAVLVYPNPVSDVLTIQNLAALEGEAVIELIAPNGAVVNTLTIPQGTVTLRQIPVDNLASGLYFVRIRFENGERRTIKVSKF